MSHGLTLKVAFGLRLAYSCRQLDTSL